MTAELNWTERSGAGDGYRWPGSGCQATLYYVHTSTLSGDTPRVIEDTHDFFFILALNEFQYQEKKTPKKYVVPVHCNRSYYIKNKLPAAVGCQILSPNVTRSYSSLARIASTLNWETPRSHRGHPRIYFTIKPPISYSQTSTNTCNYATRVPSPPLAVYAQNILVDCKKALHPKTGSKLWILNWTKAVVGLHEKVQRYFNQTPVPVTTRGRGFCISSRGTPPWRGF